MNKLWLLAVFFLVFGALTIREQTSDTKSFAIRFFDWISGVAGNLKDLTGRAVNDYSWLPDKNITLNESVQSTDTQGRS